ncbi:testican-2 isoform X2 [Protopterus annectens]|uniref:testican-2 isoform X2 n=1 Tax=Protopterus annectens TaxID=7888 RepID=UPI001CFB1DF1|nr:testican-2 isoform X2 [Protopterus annectens]
MRSSSLPPSSLKPCRSESHNQVTLQCLWIQRTARLFPLKIAGCEVASGGLKFVLPSSAKHQREQLQAKRKTRMQTLGYSLLPLLILAVQTAASERDVKGGKDAENPGNFMEDEQWLSSISQYSGKIKHWNRFRDDDYIRSWDGKQPFDEALDTTKDPCQKVKCSRHKVCIAQGYQRAICVSRKKLEHRIKLPAQKLHGNKEGPCKPCHVTQPAAVCGSDGHTYASTCKLEQQACLTGKEITVKCASQCPCATEHTPIADVDPRQEPCTGQDLADLGDRLRDWFQLLHENAKQNNTGNPGGNSPVLDKSAVAGCKDSIGWMFTKLDTNADLFLDKPELAAINLDKYEICVRPFFNSCDTYRDGKVSTAEWCFCFWREKPPCLAELERIQIQEAGKKKAGTFIPSCDEDGYYRKMQCDQNNGECWCVDQHGSELSGTRMHGTPDCDDLVGFSGDFGSGVGWEDEEEKEAEENGEETEEEEAGEADDGGYIW